MTIKTYNKATQIVRNIEDVKNEFDRLTKFEANPAGITIIVPSILVREITKVFADKYEQLKKQLDEL